jgi:hypothetical protein
MELNTIKNFLEEKKFILLRSSLYLIGAFGGATPVCKKEVAV